jgi:hypothetical protein
VQIEHVSGDDDAADAGIRLEREIGKPAEEAVGLLATLGRAWSEVIVPGA